MYRREPKTDVKGHIEWTNFTDQAAAAQAMADVDGTGVATPAEAENNATVDLSELHPDPADQDAVAKAVLSRYRELIA